MNEYINEVIIEPQISPRRNESVIAWVNRQAQIDGDIIRSTEPSVSMPLGENLIQKRWLIWGLITTFGTGTNLIFTSLHPEAGLRGVATSLVGSAVLAAMIRFTERH